MGTFISRVISFVITAGGWMLAGIRTILDAIGYSTAPDDVGVAMNRLDQFLTWLLGLPWWVPWGFALISTLWLMWISWPRSAASNVEMMRDPNEQIVQPVGDSASLKGTVADPSPLNSDRLYVGQMRVGIAGLSKTRVIEFVLHCYNGSDNVLFVHRAGGSFEAAYTSKDGESAPLGEFSGAVISDALPVERIPPHKEFVISLEQRVTKDFADKILGLDAGGNVMLNFAKFDINVGSHCDRKTLVRLPIWDGIRLSRDEGLIQGRVIALRANGLVAGKSDAG